VSLLVLVIDHYTFNLNRVNLFVTVSHSYGHDKIDNMIMITGKTLALTTCSKISTQTHKKHHFNLMGLTIKQKLQLSYLKIVFFHSLTSAVFATVK